MIIYPLVSISLMIDLQCYLQWWHDFLLARASALSSSLLLGICLSSIKQDAFALWLLPSVVSCQTIINQLHEKLNCHFLCLIFFETNTMCPLLHFAASIWGWNLLLLSRSFVKISVFLCLFQSSTRRCCGTACFLAAL